MISFTMVSKVFFVSVGTAYWMCFSRSSRNIEIVYSSYQLSKYLNVPINYPLIYMYGLVYDQDDVPAYRNQHFIVGDKFTLTL